MSSLLPEEAGVGDPAPRQPQGFAWFVDQFEEIIAATAVVVVVLSVGWGVLTRYILAQPAAWAGEIATLGFAWVVFFGAAACIKYKLHPTIDLLVERLPPSLRTPVVWFNHILLLAFFTFMVWFGVRFAIDAMDLPSAVLQLPMVWLYGPVALSFLLMMIRYLQVLAGRRWHIAADRETHAG
jgi:TRAP-type C4-dicarboxylate transport system permease small subunit